MAKDYSEKDVIRAWSDKAGQQDRYDLRVIETEDGKKQTQLVDKFTGSLTIAVDGEGAEANRTLVERAGDALIDDGESPKESVEDDEKQHTSEGVLATPTQPENLEAEKAPVEIENSDEGQPKEEHLERPEDKINKEQ